MLVLAGESDGLNTLWKDKESQNYFIEAMLKHASDYIDWSMFLLCIGGYIKSVKASIVIAERVFENFKSWINAKRSPDNENIMVH